MLQSKFYLQETLKKKRILFSIFPELENTVEGEKDYDEYFSDLMRKSVNHLRREPTKLKIEAEEMSKQMDELAINNYKTFINSYSLIRDVKKQANLFLHFHIFL